MFGGCAMFGYARRVRLAIAFLLPVFLACSDPAAPVEREEEIVSPEADQPAPPHGVGLISLDNDFEGATEGRSRSYAVSLGGMVNETLPLLLTKMSP